MQRCCSRRPNLRICFAGSPIGAVECFLLSPKQRLSYCRRYPGILQSHPPIPAPNFPVGVRLGLVGPVGGSEPRLCICRAPPGRRERCNSLQCLRRKKNPRIEAWLALARPESWMDAIEQAIAPLCTHLVTKDHPRAFGFVNGVKYNNTDSKMELLVEQTCLSASTTELRKCKQQWWFSWRNRLSSGERQSEEPQHAVGFLMLCPSLSCRHPKAS